MRPSLVVRSRRMSGSGRSGQAVVRVRHPSRSRERADGHREREMDQAACWGHMAPGRGSWRVSRSMPNMQPGHRGRGGRRCRHGAAEIVPQSVSSRLLESGPRSRQGSRTTRCGPTEAAFQQPFAGSQEGSNVRVHEPLRFGLSEVVLDEVTHRIHSPQGRRGCRRPGSSRGVGQRR